MPKSKSKSDFCLSKAQELIFSSSEITETDFLAIQPFKSRRLIQKVRSVLCKDSVWKVFSVGRRSPRHWILIVEDGRGRAS